MAPVINHHTALIYVMVTMSAVDRRIEDEELARIGNIVRTLPVFDDFDENKLLHISNECGEILSADGGLDAMLGLVKEALPKKLHETAYAVAVDVAAADLTVQPEEIRFLQMLRDTFGLDKLHIAAIEHGTRARHMRV